MRLKSNSEFQRVFSAGRRCKGNPFSILALTNDYPHPRLGISVAKRNVRNAVARNRIKRIIRESFRNVQQQLVNVDVVVIVHPGANQANNRQLSEQLEKQWQKFIE